MISRCCLLSGAGRGLVRESAPDERMLVAVAAPQPGPASRSGGAGGGS